MFFLGQSRTFRGAHRTCKPLVMLLAMISKFAGILKKVTRFHVQRSESGPFITKIRNNCRKNCVTVALSNTAKPRPRGFHVHRHADYKSMVHKLYTRWHHTSKHFDDITCDCCLSVTSPDSRWENTGGRRRSWSPSVRQKIKKKRRRNQLYFCKKKKSYLKCCDITMLGGGGACAINKCVTQRLNPDDVWNDCRCLKSMHPPLPAQPPLLATDTQWTYGESDWMFPFCFGTFAHFPISLSFSGTSSHHVLSEVMTTSFAPPTPPLSFAARHQVVLCDIITMNVDPFVLKRWTCDELSHRRQWTKLH